MKSTSERYTNTDIKLIACSNRQLRTSIILLLVLAILTTILMINTVITQNLMVETYEKTELLIRHHLKNPTVAFVNTTETSVSKLHTKSLPEPTKRPVVLESKNGFAWPAENSICKTKNDTSQKSLLNIVHSARENRHKRKMIRKTWGSVKNFYNWTISTVFILGDKAITENQQLTANITNEARNYGDIALKLDFIDTYHNLSEKHAMGYDWVSKFCSHATAVLKSDDDFVIDVFKVIKWLNKTRLNGYYCRVYGRNRPSRNPKSKWFVPKKEYPNKKFPPFCSGGVYIVNTSVIARVLKNLPQVTKIWLDDVYVTGLGVQMANVVKNKTSVIKHNDRSQEYVYYHWDLLSGMDLIRDWAASSLKISPWSFILVEHSPQYSKDFEMIWTKIINLHNYY